MEVFRKFSKAFLHNRFHIPTLSYGLSSDDHIQICLYSLCNTQVHVFLDREIQFDTPQQRSCELQELYIMYRWVIHKTFADVQ